MIRPMSAFTDFVRRIRQGDQAAAAELVRRYEPLIRREVRLRLTDPALYRLFDSADICQSVLRGVFVRMAAGEYDLDRPEDLAALLLRMARNKTASAARRARCRAADVRRSPDPSAALAAVGDSAVDPLQAVIDRDLLEEVLRRLTDEENELAELRAAGLSWREIADRLGGTPEARRKQLTRGLDRVTAQLGLDQD